ncbi:MAG: beta family protein [Planctomycetota bacterium]
MLFDHTHYVANVRWKQAEKESLQWLGKREKRQLTALIELIPRNFRTKDGKDLPIRDSLRRIASDLDRYWGSTPAFIDLAHVVEAGICGAGNDPHVFELLAEETRRAFPLLPRESSLIPVTGLSRGEDYEAAIASIVEEDQMGACIRVTLDDLSKTTFSAKLEAVLSRLMIDVPDVDLVIDLQCLNGAAPNLQDVSAAIPQLSKWHSYTILAGAFPKDLQEIEKDSVDTLPRDEWFYWREQVQLLPKGMRWPTFGDYTVQHAIYKEPKKNCNPSASIRYTFDDYWVIMRGHGLTHKGSLGNVQYTAEAQLLCEMDEFCDAQFSEGDRYIYEASKNPNEPGTPFTWLRAGINHHMVYALRQIAAFVKTASTTASVP